MTFTWSNRRCEKDEAWQHFLFYVGRVQEERVGRGKSLATFSEEQWRGFKNGFHAGRRPWELEVLPDAEDGPTERLRWALDTDTGNRWWRKFVKACNRFLPPSEPVPRAYWTWYLRGTNAHE